MVWNPKHILAAIGLIFAVVAAIWPNNILMAAGVVMISVAELIS